MEDIIHSPGGEKTRSSKSGRRICIYRGVGRRRVEIIP
jgi:hypothetical protein